MRNKTRCDGGQLGASSREENAPAEQEVTGGSSRLHTPSRERCHPDADLCLWVEKMGNGYLHRNGRMGEMAVVVEIHCPKPTAFSNLSFYLPFILSHPIHLTVAERWCSG